MSVSLRANVYSVRSNHGTFVNTIKVGSEPIDLCDKVHNAPPVVLLAASPAWIGGGAAVAHRHSWDLRGREQGGEEGRQACTPIARTVSCFRIV